MLKIAGLFKVHEDAVCESKPEEVGDRASSSAGAILPKRHPLELSTIITVGVRSSVSLLEAKSGFRTSSVYASIGSAGSKF